MARRIEYMLSQAYNLGYDDGYKDGYEEGKMVGSVNNQVVDADGKPVTVETLKNACEIVRTTTRQKMIDKACELFNLEESYKKKDMKKEKEKKYTLTVTESQLALIAQCVEDCHRFMAGQMKLFNMTSLLDSYHDLQNSLECLKPLVTPELSRNSYHKWSGISCKNEHQRKFIAKTYCIYREILHRMRILNRTDNDTYNVYDGETLTCEEGGELPKIELVK